MKRNPFYYLTMFFLMVCLGAQSHAQTWKQSATYNQNTIYGMSFPTVNTGYLVDRDSLVKKTVNGGYEWTVLQGAPSGAAKAIYFMDNDTGFVGASDNIYKTEDGGSTWQPLNLPDSLKTQIGNLTNVYFTNSQNGWLCYTTMSTGQSAIYNTSNGGTSWDTVLTDNVNDFSSMTFYKHTAQGLVVGSNSSIYYSYDGLQWTKAPTPVLPPGYTRSDIYGSFLQDSLVLFATGWGSIVGLQPTIQLKSTDGGKNWEYITQSSENAVYNNMYAIYFKDSVNGLEIGNATSGSALLGTTDGGVNWVPKFIPSGASLDKMFGFGDTIVVAGDGTILVSEDFGETWSLTETITRATLYAVSAPSDNVIYAGGQTGYLLKSTDGGDSWESSYAMNGINTATINSLYFVNENVGYAGYYYGAIAKTTDGGQSWQGQVAIDPAMNTSYIYGMNFVDENYGFAVGKVKTNVDLIYKTTNGGADWTDTTNIVNADLKAVAFTDKNNGVVVGNKLKSAYTTDGGDTWNASTFQNVPSTLASANLSQVTFTNGMEAVAVGNKIFLHSTDGGATWDYVSDVDTTVANLVGLTFKDSVNGYATGSSPIIEETMGVYNTTDGGLSWKYLMDTLDVPTTQTHYALASTPSGKIFAVTASSGIYSLTTKIIGVEDEPNGPVTYNLAQNYPNPFNPETTIQFSIPSQERITLKVYDILGKEIATLVNETMSAGTHAVRFSSNNYRLASGVYFYVLKGENFMQTKKMVLLK